MSELCHTQQECQSEWIQGGFMFGEGDHILFGVCVCVCVCVCVYVCVHRERYSRSGIRLKLCLKS